MFDEFIGKEIFVKKLDGYHYGILVAYDHEKLSVDSYWFSPKPLDIFSYSREAFGSGPAIIPLAGMTSVGEIPQNVRKEEEKDKWSFDR